MTQQAYKPPRCNQDTRRGEQCQHRATWSRIERGERELYCTRHVNLVTANPLARGFVPIDLIKFARDRGLT